MKITIDKLFANENGGVVSVKWTMTAQKNDVQIKEIGNTKFEPDASSPTFVPFNQLTEDQVIAWISKNINQQAIEQRLNEMSSVQQSVSDVAFPWVIGGSNVA